MGENVSENFHELTPARAEALALLLEELGEAQQAIGKILRHGLHERHPARSTSNQEELEKELGDVRAAIIVAKALGVVTTTGIELATSLKIGRVGRYLHHIDVNLDGGRLTISPKERP